MKKVFLSIAVLACVGMVSCKKAAPAEEATTEEATEVVAEEAPATEEEASAADEEAPATEEEAPAAE